MVANHDLAGKELAAGPHTLFVRLDRLLFLPIDLQDSTSKKDVAGSYISGQPPIEIAIFVALGGRHYVGGLWIEVIQKRL